MNATAPVSPADRVAPALPQRRFVPSRARLLALWPAVLAAALFLGLMTHEIVAIKAQEGGRYVYPIDDTYGHLATAKNLVEHGRWTYNAAYDFESSVSSLIWPPLIAICFAIFGIHDYIPLVLNILICVGLFFYASEALRRIGCPGPLTFLTLVGIIILVPLCAIASLGMEHSLQLLLTIVFLDLAARLLMDDPGTLVNRRTPFWLCVAGTLLVTTRYEGLFQIAAVGLLLLCRRRWRLAIIMGVAAVTPITLFGLYSLHKGWYFLPDSLLMKGNTTHLTPTLAGLIQYFSKGYTTMMSEPHVPALILAGVVALFGTLQRRWSLWTYPALVLILGLITAAQHFQYAALGWFYRYEAYLIGLIVFGVGAVVGQARAETPLSSWLRPVGVVYALVLALAVFLFGAPMWPRAINCYPHIISGSYSIYGQQYQMARFVRRFYDGKGVMANDVCAISYLSDNVDLFDFVGLSDVQALRLKLNGQMNPAAIRRLIGQHHCHIAIVYDTWIQGMIRRPAAGVGQAGHLDDPAQHGVRG